MARKYFCDRASCKKEIIQATLANNVKFPNGSESHLCDECKMALLDLTNKWLVNVPS